MSQMRETCGCGAVWEGGSAYVEEREKFRAAHEACRQPSKGGLEEGPNVLTSEEATAIVAAALGEDHHAPTLDAALKRLGEWVDSQLGLQPQPDPSGTEES